MTMLESSRKKSCAARSVSLFSRLGGTRGACERARVRRDPHAHPMRDADGHTTRQPERETDAAPAPLRPSRASLIRIRSGDRTGSHQSSLVTRQASLRGTTPAPIPRRTTPWYRMGEIERLKRALSRLEPSDGNKSHDCTARVVHDGLGPDAPHGTAPRRLERRLMSHSL